MKILKQKGVSLIGAMIGVAAIIVLGGAVLKYGNAKNADSEFKGRGAQYSTAMEGLKTYARKYRANLYNGQAIPGYTLYSPTIEQLKNDGLLSTSFNPSSSPALGGSLVTRIDIEPSGCSSNCLLSLKVLPSGAIVGKDGTPNYVAAGAIADGMNGYGWSNTPINPQILNRAAKSITNPLGTMPAVAAAVDWLASNQTLPNFTSTETQTLPCPAPQVGVIVQTRTRTELQAGGYDYSAWTTISSTCAIPPPPPTCANGAPDYPVCTPPVTPTCANGASNYPICSFPPPPTGTCSNGATNYPICGCTNGYTNYPICGQASPPPPPPPSCANGQALVNGTCQEPCPRLGGTPWQWWFFWTGDAHNYQPKATCGLSMGHDLGAGTGQRLFDEAQSLGFTCHDLNEGWQGGEAGANNWYVQFWCDARFAHY